MLSSHQKKLWHLKNSGCTFGVLDLFVGVQCPPHPHPPAAIVFVCVLNLVLVFGGESNLMVKSSSVIRSFLSLVIRRYLDNNI